MKPEANPKAQEEKEQKYLMDWARKQRVYGDDVLSGAFISDYLYAVPNGGSRGFRVDDRGRRYSVEGQKLEAMGLKAGVSDLVLPLARCGFHQLFIELKREFSAFPNASEAKAAASDAQLYWIEKMKRAGNAAVICYGWAEAQEVLGPYAAGMVAPFQQAYTRIGNRFNGLSRRSV